MKPGESILPAALEGSTVPKEKPAKGRGSCIRDPPVKSLSQNSTRGGQRRNGRPSSACGSRAVCTDPGLQPPSGPPEEPRVRAQTGSLSPLRWTTDKV